MARPRSDGIGPRPIPKFAQGSEVPGGGPRRSSKVGRRGPGRDRWGALIATNCRHKAQKFQEAGHTATGPTDDAIAELPRRMQRKLAKRVDPIAGKPERAFFFCDFSLVDEVGDVICPAGCDRACTKMSDEEKPISDERAAFYKRKADEVRGQAKAATSEEARSRDIAIAESYARLAKGIAGSKDERPKD